MPRPKRHDVLSARSAPPPQEAAPASGRKGAPRPEPSGALSGADLRRLREERGITLDEIGSKTNLTKTLLQHFENDRYDRLPPPVYVRSFLQQYARAVGLDPKVTADAYLSRVPRAR